MSNKTKFIFVCGGVLSGVGKGVVTASLGMLLQSKGYKVNATKIDPYLNIDAGLMRPAEHGEVFVTEDGAEIDQDLGNYERFLGIEFSRHNNITSGKIYQSIINKERAMFYGGRDVEVFPDLINEIKESLLANVRPDDDIMLVEIGGTSGDVENVPFLHASREMSREFPAAHIMVTYLPYLKTVGELKTKPTQHAVAHLREVGVIPDFIVTRNEIPLDEPRRETISKRCFIDNENIIDNPDTESIYDIPLLFEREKFADKVLKHLGEKPRSSDMLQWSLFSKVVRSSDKRVKIGMVGKYVMHGNTEHRDTYISVIEAINHAAGNLGYKPEITMINSKQFEDQSDTAQMLEEFDAVIVPQGWGSRGSEGKINAIQYVRENKIPYLGLCYGMQMAVIEYAQNVLGLKKATSEEIDPKTKEPVIHIMPDQKEYLAKHQYGGTIRLGGWDTKLDKDSLTYKVYDQWNGFKDKKSHTVSERHRHRYEFNNDYREKLENAGLKIVGTSPDNLLVEFVELPQEVHPYFIGTQGHPEYKSQPMKPHPLFLGLIEAAIKRRNLPA